MTKQIKKLSLALLALLATIVFVLGAVSFKSPVSGVADALADAQIYGLDFADADNRGKNTVGDLADATIVSDGITYTEDAINGKTAINLPGTGVRTNYISIDKEVLNNDVVTFAGWFKLPSNGNTWSRPINVFVDGSNRVEVMPITDANQNTVLNISFIVNGVAYSNQGYDSTLYNVQSESAWGASYKYPTYNLQSYFNTWAHYAYTFTPETISYYVNGELCASVKTTDMSHRTADNMSFSLKQFYGENAKVAIGATFTDSTKDYKGSIADLRIYNKALTEEELVSISGVDKLTYKDKLISLYNFESGTKDSIRVFDGSLVNTAKVEYNSKIGSNVLALDGAGTSKNASMMTVDSKALHGLKEFTISVDVNILNNVGGYARIFDYAPNVAQQLVLAVKWNNTNVMKAKYTNNETVADKKHEVNYDFNLYGSWRNVALTVDGETAKIYIDGKLVSSGAFPYNPNVFSNSTATKLTFGGTYYSSDAGTPCYMDNIKIYSCALTEDEIATEYVTENPVPEQEWFVTPLSDVKLAEGSWLEELSQTNIDYMMSMDKDRMLYNHRMVAGLDTKGATSYQGWEAPNRGLSGQYASNYLAGLVRAAAHMGDYEYNGETVLERLDYLLKEFQKCQEAYAVLDPANAGYFGGLCMDQFNAYVGKGPYIWAPSASGTYTTVLEGQTGNPRGYGSYLKTTFPNGSQEIVFIWVPWRVNHDNLKALYDVYMYAPTAELKEIGKEMMFAHADWCYNTIYGYTEAQRNRLPSIEYGGMAEALYNISYEAKKLGLNEKAANYAWAGQYFMEGNLISDWYNNVDNLSSGSHNNLKGKHANTTIPKIFACMAAFEATSDEYYFTAAVNAFDMLMTRIYAMGGTSLYENWQHDSYCLQTGSSTCETCCTLNMLKLADYLFKWTGDKKYADFYEFAFTNHTLSSMDPDTGYKTYFVGTAFGDHKVYHTYDQSFWCCTSTGLESFAKLNYAIYYKSLDASAVSVNMFYPSVYTHSDDITIIQSGNLNEDQKTVFTIDGAGALTLRLRNPDWTKGASFKLNGEDFTDFTLKDGYYEISRTWVDGDKLEYNLPFKFYTVKLNNSSNFATIMYGPLTLVADLGNEGFNDIRQNQTEYPSAYTGAIKNKLAVLGGDFEANSTVEFDANGKMTVKINTLNQGVLTFKPFNEVFHSRYGMYFDMIDTSDLEDKYIVDGNTYVNTFDVENDVASNKLTSGNVTVAGGVLTTSETENSGYLTNGASKVLTKFEVKPATTQNGPIDIALIVLAKSNGTIDSITGYAVMVKKPAYDYGITLTINKIVNGEVGDAIVTKTITTT